MKLCRLSSREDECLLSEKIKQFGHLFTEQVGIGQFFTLNDSSRLKGMLKEVKRALNIKEISSPAKMPTESTAVGETVVVEVADEGYIAE